MLGCLRRVLARPNLGLPLLQGTLLGYRLVGDEIIFRGQRVEGIPMVELGKPHATFGNCYVPSYELEL
jgi:hypothetical protein